jgi:hypothetical protein
MTKELHDLIHLLSETQKLIDKIGKVIEEMVKEEAKDEQ